MFIWYVPGATRTVSPSLAAFIPAWIEAKGKEEEQKIESDPKVDTCQVSADVSLIPE